MAQARAGLRLCAAALLALPLLPAGMAVADSSAAAQADVVVAEAMRTAKIDKLDERTRRPRKPWHSFRSTFARQMLEQGRSPQWVQAQLGHATLELTYKVYGQWTEEAMAAEAAKPPGYDAETRPAVASVILDSDRSGRRSR